MQNIKPEKGKNQTMARDANLSLIMQSIRNGDMSRVDISRMFKLSKPTASKITAELEALGLICAGGEEQTNVPGVKATKYAINDGLGLFAVIDLSTVVIRADVYSFGGAKLSEIIISDKELIRKADIERLCGLLDEVLASQRFSGKSLLGVCIAVPCAVNKNTGKIFWSARFDVEEDFDLRSYLADRYGVDILVKNDVQLMLIGEMSKGLLSDGKHRYALLAYIDAGIGGSFYLSGKVEDGADGTAGDLGFAPYCEDGKTYLLDSVISINAIKKKLAERLAAGEQSALGSKGEIRFKDIEEAYLSGDGLAVKTISETACKAGTALRSLIKIFNVNLIIICGRITRLGDGYISALRDSLKDLTELEVKYSALGDSALHAGAVMLLQDHVIGEKISNRRTE